MNPACVPFWTTTPAARARKRPPHATWGPRTSLAPKPSCGMFACALEESPARADDVVPPLPGATAISAASRSSKPYPV
jgi:hypothetical protein